MTQNVGGIDRMLRIVAGLALIILAATGTIGPWGWLGVIVLGFMAGERGEGRSERSLKHLRPRIARPVETNLTAHHCPVVRAKRLPVPPVVAA